MKLNAKPRMSLKLMQICKRFKHQEFPYFVIKTIKCVWDRWIYITLDGKTIKKENLEDVPNNLWITKSIIFSISEIDYAAFMDKVVASDVEEMILGQVKVPFNLIKPLCENVKMFNSMTTHLQDDDNENDISFDELLEGLPNLENLFM
uniref:Uncharacterized protein n=1 Tax=Panagrolaimus sp. ES5 TaxID=591445 RepID=A0AC34G0P2_9BILA